MSTGAVERYLVDDLGAQLTLTEVIEHGLTGLACERLGGSAPAKLVAARALAKREHERNRELVAALVAAWAEEGVETLLFKGFALAEFVYPDAAWRPYSDVDAAIDPAHLEAAHARALALGWRVVWRPGETVDAWSHHGADYYGHELMLLDHPSGLSLDLHRRLLHNNDNRVPHYPHQQRITDAVWRAAQAADLSGVRVLLPSAEDMALVGLVLNRYWSGDRYELRATDYLDLQWLMGLETTEGRRAGAEVGERQHRLRLRARELGCSRTLEAFLRRCDPFAGRLDLPPLNRRAVAALDVELAREHGHRVLARLPRDVLANFRLAVAAARELPRAHRAGRDLAEQGLERLVAIADVDEDAAAAATLSHATWKGRQAAARAAVRLLRRGGFDDATYFLTLAQSLRDSGVPVALRAQAPGDGQGATFELRLAGRRLPLTE